MAGTVHTNEKEIREVFTEPFSKLFTAKSELDMEEVIGDVEHKTTEEMQHAFA